MKHLLLFLLPFSIAFDLLTQTVFSVGGSVSLIRPIIILIPLSLVILSYVPTRATAGVYLFCLYIALQLPASPDVYTSLRISAKVILSFLMFPFGYYVVKDWHRLSMLNRSTVLVGLIFVANFAVSQYFGIGVSDYTKSDDFLLGSLADSWNIVVYTLLVMPLILLTESKNTRFLAALSIVLSLLVIIGLKRVAIIALFSGYAFYAMFLYRISVVNVFRFGLLLSVIGVGVLANLELLEMRVMARGDKMATDILYVLQQEGRYAETVAVWKGLLQFERPLDVLFGLTPFNSVGNYGYEFGGRQLHIDYNLIVNTLGIVGLVGYFSMFTLIGLQFLTVKRRIISRDLYVDTLVKVFVCIFFIQFITSLGGQMYSFTFRALVFIYLGGILRLLVEEGVRRRGLSD